jgi:hypothetical protein
MPENGHFRGSVAIKSLLSVMGAVPANIRKTASGACMAMVVAGSAGIA